MSILKTILPFLVSSAMALISLGIHMSPNSDSMLNQHSDRISNGYLTYTLNYHKELPAFSRRPLTSFLIETTSRYSGLQIGTSFILVNYVLFFISGVLLFALSFHLSKNYWQSLGNIVAYFLTFSVLFAFFSPIYTYDEPLQYGLVFLGLWAYFSEKNLLFVFAFTLAAIARETSLLLLPALFFFYGFSQKKIIKQGTPHIWSKTVNILLPFAFYAIFIGFFLWNYAMLGAAQTELSNRFSCFVENFESPKNTIESIVSLFLVLGGYLYLLANTVQRRRLTPLEHRFVRAFLLVFCINTIIVLLFTFARESRLFALPLFFIWPLAIPLFLRELHILCNPERYYHCFRKWYNVLALVFLIFLNYILSFKVYTSHYDPSGHSHWFNEYLFILLLIISVHFLLSGFLDKHTSKDNKLKHSN